MLSMLFIYLSASLLKNFQTLYPIATKFENATEDSKL